MQVSRNSQQLLLSTARADTSMRNFLITKDPKYVVLYNLTKNSLKKETVDLVNLTRTNTVLALLQSRLTPTLSGFLLASDELLNDGSTEQHLLARQESARVALEVAVKEVQEMQLKLLQERNDRLSLLSTKMATVRLLALIVALVAIIFSIITLRSVMRKDRHKIDSKDPDILRSLLLCFYLFWCSSAGSSTCAF
jgi:CHASE3 domain sensor protein